jgi:hydrogenase nickel incorporation protein HypA/HybF
VHELSIARAVVAEVTDAARLHGADGVRSVTLSIGRLAGVVPDALVFGFELASEATMLEGAELIIEIEPTVVWCPDGEHQVELADMRFVCPEHGCATPELLSGKQLDIVRFETVDADPAEPGSAEPQSAEGVTTDGLAANR